MFSGLPQHQAQIPLLVFPQRAPHETKYLQPSHELPLKETYHSNQTDGQHITFVKHTRVHTHYAEIAKLAGSKNQMQQASIIKG